MPQNNYIWDSVFQYVEWANHARVEDHKLLQTSPNVLQFNLKKINLSSGDDYKILHSQPTELNESPAWYLSIKST